MTDAGYLAVTTYRLFQIHIAAFYKDRFLLVSTLRPALEAGLHALGLETRGDAAAENEETRPEPAHEPRRSRGRLPSWYSPPEWQYGVIDNEGPLESLRTFAHWSQDVTK